jgi:hypothetical protein
MYSVRNAPNSHILETSLHAKFRALLWKYETRTEFFDTVCTCFAFSKIEDILSEGSATEWLWHAELLISAEDRTMWFNPPKLIRIIFKHPVRTSKRTPQFIIRKINWLMVFQFTPRIHITDKYALDKRQNYSLLNSWCIQLSHDSKI